MDYGYLFLILLVLACPISMWLMMRDRNGHGGRMRRM